MTPLIRINGAAGRLGAQIANHLYHYKNTSEEDAYDVDLTRQSAPYVHFPKVIIHTSWQTNVDKCTTEPLESAFICLKGFRNALDMCSWGSHLIFVSSSYVFSGDEGNYDAGSNEHPVQAYGALKHKAEKEILKMRDHVLASNTHLAIIRTDALYDENKQYRYERSAVDQISNPTYQPFLAKVIAKYALQLLRDEHVNNDVFARSIYHVTGDEVMSRHEFVKRYSNPHTKPCHMSDLNLPAKRPANSSLVVSNDFIDALGVDRVSVDEAARMDSLRVF